MDMQEKIIYMKTPKDQLQYIYYHDCRQSYPTHTHASHIVIGCVLEGGGSSSCQRGAEVCLRSGQPVLYPARHGAWNRSAGQHHLFDDKQLYPCAANQCRS